MRLVVILLPAIQAGVIAFFCILRYKNALPMPQWNDEGAYYELIKTWLATGQPLGYWGFNGGHALVGTGSAWSPAILLPYALWGMMFGWNYSSACFANIVFLMLAQLLFVLLTKADEKQLFRMILLQLCSVMIWLYLPTLMSELFRYALAVVLAGMLYRLYFLPCKKTFRYLIVPLYLLAAIQVYIFFVFAIPLYICGILKGQSWWKKLLLSVAALLVAGGGSYYLLHLISSNYNIYKTELLFTALQSGNLLAVIRAALSMLKEGLWGLYSCFRSYSGHGLFKWFVPFLGLLFLLPAGLFLGTGKKYGKISNAAGHGESANAAGHEESTKAAGQEDRSLCLQTAFSVALFVGAFITVYSMEVFTFFRSTGILVLFCMSLLLMTKNRWLFPVLLGCYALGLVFLPTNLKDFTAERYPAQETRLQWEKLGEELEQAIPLKETEDPWENTVVLYTLEPRVIAAMPAGAGVNMMLYSEEIPKEAGYLFFSKTGAEGRPDWLEQDYFSILSENDRLLKTEYQILWESPEYVLYGRITREKIHRYAMDYTFQIVRDLLLSM